MRLLLLACVAVLLAGGSRATDLPGFVRTASFDERVRWVTLDSGVRVYVNLPERMEAGRPTRVVVYATPNGNTLEQTIGGAKGAGVEWHYDIQHVAAQVRRLREVDGRENIVLAVVQAPKLSWPAFRAGNAEAGKVIQAVIELAKEGLAGKSVSVDLTGHSGGGSFIFGVINSVEAIPHWVGRVAFLDANYSYDDGAGHGEKLLAWLRGDAGRRLVVIAYDDREIALDGKKVVGPTGGTFRATGRMVERLKKDGEVREATDGAFKTYSAMGGQVWCFVHPNLENKILHTALVGEMNGLLHALALGTSEEGKWGTFGGPRAYERWVAAALTVAPPPAATRATTAPASRPSGGAATRPAGVGEGPRFPPRPEGAEGGAAFAKRIESLAPREREAAIGQEILRGNVPNFLRRFATIRAEVVGADGARHTIAYGVTRDYLAVGSDADFFRVPMTPGAARAIADATGCEMVTRKVADDVYRAAEVKLEPRPMTERREEVATFYEHQRIIEAQRVASGQAAGALISGIKKDVVISNRLRERPGRVAIYGWHKLDGSPIQPLTIVHAARYVDYSHGVRLMGRAVVADGTVRDARELLKDAKLSALLSDEGPLDVDDEYGGTP
jgi:hypothetical protein